MVMEKQIKKTHNRPSTDLVLMDIIKSGLKKQTNEVESLALILSRLMRDENPDMSKKISELLSTYSLTGSVNRGASLPTDSDSHLDMVTVISPSKDIYIQPILHGVLKNKVDNFLEERENISLLLDRGIKPSTSMMLIGQPGTGKTMLARYVASALGKDLIILDLSSSISSLLGKTGQNLKKVLQFAKQSSAVLLFDEFDAIAKKRDDTTDLGEIKRIVNVLLMELDSWPASSVVMATSNHPELLDRAIWRRFDHVLELSLPEIEERRKILDLEFRDFMDKEVELMIPALAELLEGKSGSDIHKFAENIKRRMILKKEEALVACVKELELSIQDKKAKGRFCKIAKESLGKKISVRKLSQITGLSLGGVQHHTSKQKNESKQ